jgi:hypothetical protein
VPADPILILTSAAPPNPSERVMDGFFYILVRRRGA